MAGAQEIRPEMQRYLDTGVGWYGVVTEREFLEDRCFTVKTEQQTLIEDHFGDDVKRRKGYGGRKNLIAAGISSTSPFRVLSTDTVEELVLLYPKKVGNEFRLYFKQGVFAPQAGDQVYIFIKDREIYLAVFDPETVDAICRHVGKRFMLTEGSGRLEEELDDYQMILNQPNPPEKILTQSFAWRRSPVVARRALVNSGFKCELMPDLDLFTSRSTQKPFLEVHHLVPMKQQSRFETSLDIIENLCVLNPLAHRMVHHAVFSELEPYLESLYKSRKAFFESIDYGLEELKLTYQ